ncbi:hypothetical protein [Thermohalobacter berrensis]|uniref:Uncharacterized protein n=1 Tax=Thermohalobacter berrensis TaxID=99594 RepID=A0A419SXZ1_9FIRM|nr:hypothetical protein [Thermohalobacter berrensis]RKD30066.1 hypothetical protein BET03_05010 [Thermohalobacter berrensis]
MFSKNIELDYDIVVKNKVPILIQDKSWKKLFGDVQEKEIVKYKEQLKSLIKEEIEIERKLNQANSKKKRIMAKILNTSNEINNRNNKNSVNKLDILKEEIHNLNDEIDELTFRLEVLPREIRITNYNLLLATVKYAYKELKMDHKKLETANEKIEILRNQLRELIEEKHEHEEKISNTYSFLHGILGSKVMEQLDKQML